MPEAGRTGAGATTTEGAIECLKIDKFLVGNFQRAATLYDRWTPRVEVSTEHADFFTRNLVAILAEERIALASRTPLLSPMETSAMSHNVKVRTIRPHDTAQGFKAPGDKYERTAADAKQLSDHGVVEIVKPKATKAK